MVNHRETDRQTDLGAVVWIFVAVVSTVVISITQPVRMDTPSTTARARHVTRVALERRYTSTAPTRSLRITCVLPCTGAAPSGESYGGNCRLAESNGSLPPGLRRDSLHVTCRLTLPVHRDQLRAQRSATSTGKLYLALTRLPKVIWKQAASSHLVADPLKAAANNRSTVFSGGVNVYAHLMHDSLGQPRPSFETSKEPFDIIADNKFSASARSPQLLASSCTIQ